MADDHVAATPAADNPRHHDQIACIIAASLEANLAVTTDPSKLTAIQLQVTAGDTAVGVLALTVDGALDLVFRLIAAAGEVRRAIDRAGR
jgi:hypothetical protein